VGKDGMKRTDVRNAALVTKTLVHSGGQAVETPGELTWQRFLDFSSLCEASVILDRLDAIESTDTLPSSALTRALVDAQLLSEFRPELSRNDLRRLLLRLPDDVSRRLLPTFWEGASADSSDPATSAPTDDLRNATLMTDSGSLKDID
jgi:hypothetical protein